MEMIQNLLITILLAVWVCGSIGFIIWMVQGIFHDRKNEKREAERAARDMEYHKKRMEALK